MSINNGCPILSLGVYCVKGSGVVGDHKCPCRDGIQVGVDWVGGIGGVTGERSAWAMWGGEGGGPFLFSF